MPLFQQSVVKKYLTDLDKETLQQRWNIFVSHFHNSAIQQNILHAKEEEYQEGFVRDLFVNVLGYTLNPQPDYNFVLEKKTEADSTKSDGAIISPSSGAGGGHTIAVIELKDTATTDLDKVEKQAFGYKHRHPDCTYIITANFQKLRFYINDAIEYEEFDLFTLTQERFALLYLCFSEQTIFKNIPLLIKKASLTQEEAVTKKLYSDYSGFRKKLFHNITELNPQYSKIELFQKTQKLLDRFLFILFAEDRMLLPPNSVREILKQWQQLKELDAEVPLFDRFKKYFGYLNTGHEGKQHTIFAYNGGLFATDKILDTIKIDDTILHDSCVALSNYDFQTEVDVNILGHIFEHSLSELDELDKGLQSPGRRKKDGVFYTPRYITKYIVANTVGALCEQKKNELQLQEEEYAPQLKKKDQKQLLEKLETYRAWLLQLTICDPACGSGAFLNQALEFLISEHRYIDELNAKLGGYSIVFPDMEKSILENNLFGVDINEEAVEIARLSLWLRTAQKGRKLNNLSDNIKCGNSLIDDPAVAGDKAFNWQKAFPKIFRLKDKQPFHITFVTHYSRRNERMDKYRVPHKDGFWMNEEAELLITGYIKDTVLENNFMVLAYNICGDHVHMMIVAEETELPEIMRKIKGKTSQRFKEHLQVPKEEEFHLWAQKYSTTWLYTNEHYNNAIAYIENNRSKHELPFHKGLQPLVKSMLTTETAAYAVEYKGGFDVVIGNPPYALMQPNNTSKEQLDFFKKNFEYADFKIDLFHLFFQLGYKICKTDGLLSYIAPSTLLYNYYVEELRMWLSKNNEIKLLAVSLEKVFEDADVHTAIYLLKKSEKVSGESLINLSVNLEGVINGFEEYSTIKQKYLNETPGKVWNLLINSGNINLLTKISNNKKLIDLAKINRGLITGDRDKYFSKEKSSEKHVEILTGSDISRYYSNEPSEYVLFERPKTSGGCWDKEVHLAKHKICVRQIGFEPTAAFINRPFAVTGNIFTVIADDDSFEKFLLTILNSKVIKYYWQIMFNDFKSSFPQVTIFSLGEVPIPSIQKEQQLPFIAKADIMLAKNKELQELKQQLLQLLQSNFPEMQVSKKLAQWPSLSFAELLKELGKQKIKPTLPQQQEWMNYFEEQKAKALALQTIIDTTDKEIDAMVYALYGLTHEEIQIVEGNG